MRLGLVPGLLKSWTRTRLASLVFTAAMPGPLRQPPWCDVGLDDPTLIILQSETALASWVMSGKNATHGLACSVRGHRIKWSARTFALAYVPLRHYAGSHWQIPLTLCLDWIFLSPSLHPRAMVLRFGQPTNFQAPKCWASAQRQVTLQPDITTPTTTDWLHQAE